MFDSLFYPNDHRPPHVHGFSDGGVVIVALLEGGNVALADRKDAVWNAKSSTVRKVLRQADVNYSELVELWETYHADSDDE